MMSLFQVSTDQAIEQSNSYNIQKAEMNALLSSPGHLGGNDDDIIGKRQPAAASFGQGGLKMQIGRLKMQTQKCKKEYMQLTKEKGGSR